MKNLPAAGRYYIAYCAIVCGYFCSAAIFGWPNPIPAPLLTNEFWSDDDGGNSYSTGTYHGRGSGGFGGGGK